MEGTVFVSFHDTAPRDFSDLVEATLQVCQEIGLCELESEELVDPDTVGPDEKNQLELYDKRGSSISKLRLYFGDDDWSGPVDSFLKITTHLRNIFPDHGGPDDGYVGFGQRFVGLIRELTVELDPVYVSSFNSAYMDGEGAPLPPAVLPESLPIDLERIPWLGVYGRLLVDQFGGRDRVLDTPAWHVEELDNGSILIITTKEPWQDYGWKHPADRYLLDGDDSASL